MTRNPILISLLFLLQANLMAQSNTSVEIKEKVQQIEQDSTLNEVEKDAYEIYKEAYDGGGYVKVWFDSIAVRKIERQIGLSYGRVTTIIYLEKGIPIKIIEREENFQKDQDSIFIYGTTLSLVFEAEIFVLNWNKDESETKSTGKRVLSEGTCAYFEYEPLLELGERLAGR